jgi:hypothetical protein
MTTIPRDYFSLLQIQKNESSSDLAMVNNVVKGTRQNKTKSYPSSNDNNHLPFFTCACVQVAHSDT